MREDAWLSERFGHPVYSVDDPSEPTEGTATYQARIPTDRVDRVRAFERAGFGLVDTAVTLIRASATEPGEVLVRDARESDRDDVLGIAGSAFTQSRFHADPDVPDAVADRIKRDWAGGYFTGDRGDAMFVTEAEGRATGFLTLLAQNDANVIDLVAVAPAAQGSRAGSALVRRALAEPGAGRVRVGTQVRNTASLRLYERAGFTIESSMYILHKHSGV